jgi:Ca2+-binding EF-hand superfamily protein
MDNSNQASTNYREAFQLFDKRGNGRVDRSSLGDLLRACGQNPTLAEIGDLERGVGADCTCAPIIIPRRSPPAPAFSGLRATTDAILVDFETFSKILNRPGGFREPFDIEEYIRGFQVFDKDRSGFVGKGQIKYILTNLGEKMSEEEVDELFKSTIDASNNEVDYRGTSASAADQTARSIPLHTCARLTHSQSS